MNTKKHQSLSKLCSHILSMLLIFMAVSACQPGSESTNGAGSEAPEEPDANDDKYAEDVESPTTSVAGANLVGYDNARARCLQKKTSADKYQVVCNTVILEKNGTELLADGLGEDVHALSWRDPVVKTGSATVLSCQPSNMNLNVTCDVTVASASTVLDFSLKISKANSNSERTETTSVLLPFSVEFSAGLVPFMPSVFQAKENSKKIELGFVKKPLKKDDFGIKVHSLCSMGNTLYYSHGTSIFKQDTAGNVEVFAGSVNPANLNNFSSKESVYLGKTLEIACHDDEIFILSEHMYTNNMQTFNRVVKISKSGTASLLLGGTFDASTVDNAKIPTAFGIDPIGADMRDTTSFHVVDSGKIYLAGNRTDTKLMLFENNKIKKVVLPATDEGSYSYQGFSDVLFFNGKILLAAPSDHFIYEFDGFNLNRIIGDGTSGKVVNNTDLDDNSTAISGPRHLSSSGANLFITTNWGSIEKVNAENVITTLFDNYESASNLDYSYLQTGDVTTSKGNVDSLFALGDTILFAGNGVIREIKTETISVTAGIPNFTDFDPSTLEGDAATKILPMVRKSIGTSAKGLIILDSLNAAIYDVDASGKISHLAGNKASASKTGTNPKTVLIADPVAIAELANGDVLYALRHEIYKIVHGGGVVHFAGANTAGAPTTDGIDAKTAKIGSITDMTVRDGIVYFTEEYLNASLSVGHRIMKIDTEGKIYRVAGDPSGISGDGPLGPATSARLNAPGALSTTRTGEIIFIDSENHKIKKINLAGEISDLMGDFYGNDLSVAANGQIFVLHGETNEYGQQLSVLSQNENVYSLTNIFGGNETAKCGSGALKGSIEKTAFLKGLQGSLSLICPGDQFNSVSVVGECAQSTDNFTLILSQNFSFDGIQGYGNITKIQLPCLN